MAKNISQGKTAENLNTQHAHIQDADFAEDLMLY